MIPPFIRACPNCGGERYDVRFIEPPFRVVKCRACGLTYLGNPPPEERLYEDYYGGPEPGPEEYRPGSPVPRLAELHAINEQRIARIEQIRPAGRLLDIGCGRGHFLRTARDHGYRVAGVDVSERAVRYARSAFGLDASVETLDGLVARPDRFEVLTLWHVLEHFADPFEALRKMRLLLVPGGVLFVEVPNLHSLKFLLARQKWAGGNHPLYHRTFFSNRTLKRALLENGFSRAIRLRISYHVPGRSGGYEAVKALLNAGALDAFLDYAAWP